MTTLAERHVSRRERRCVNAYPCGGLIKAGDVYWSLALPPGSEPLYRNYWWHADECDSCHEQRFGLPLTRTETA
jgi:hypothetical protein